MKRLLYLLILSLLFASPSFAGPVHTMMMDKPWGGGGSQIVFSGTITGLRISSVDGTAFVDNLPAAITTNYCNDSHLLEIYDASGRTLKGVLREVGPGEALGDEKLTNPSFDDNSTGWSAGRGTVTSSHPAGGGQSDDYCILTSNGTAGGPYAYQTPTIATGELLSMSVYIKSGTAGATTMYIYAGTMTPLVGGISSGSWAQISGYRTLPTAAAAVFLQAQDATNLATNFFDEASVKQVTAPSANGALIVSAKGGATRNFKEKNASFTYNAASYNCIVRRLR